MSDPSKKTAVISGGAGMLGRVISADLVKRGYRAVAFVKSEPEREAAEFFKKHGVEAIVCDVTDADMVSKAMVKLGSIHAAIHAAAGRITRKPIEQTAPDELEQEISVAVRGGENFLRAAGGSMTEGVLVGITTAAIENPSASRNMGGYIRSKTELRSLLRSLHDEFKGKGIRVDAVAPDFMRGGLNSDLPAAMVDFMERDPERRLTTPEDVSRVVCDIAEGDADGRSFLIRNGALTDPHGNGL